MKLLLVNPAAEQWRVLPGQRPPLSTRVFRFSMLTSLSVAASAPEGVQVRIVDEEIEPVDFDADADVVGISLMTFNAPRAYEIADRFRREKGRRVILGGYHPTFLPGEALEHADAVCVGEAETSLPRMLEDAGAGRLKGVYAGGPANLSALRPFDRSLVSGGRYAPVSPLQATRGCGHGCSFCSITSFFGRTFRARPVANVVDELRGLGPRVLFLDDNLTASRDHAAELFGAMAPLGKTWYSQCSVTLADDAELLRLAVRSGCRGLFLGFESVSEGSLAGWGKTFARARDYTRAVRKLHEAGIGVFAGIVLGGDADGPDVFERTLEFLREASIDALQATILTPFPGTPLFAAMDREGRIVDRDWSHYDFRHVVFEPAGMSREALQAGHDDVLTRFYSLGGVFSRLGREVRYLPLSTLLFATAPLGFGYRNRLRRDGTWRSRFAAADRIPASP
ncbi:MAG TPA: radical SAM protein [Thermoanaerobaculia bacterium]|nr:radical SAM protein [Thermoanaerobaculia bacterium]